MKNNGKTQKDAGANQCGNCANFKPKHNEKFFNCTSAKQAGIRYGMQVRADTGACEAFAPLIPPPPPKTPPYEERAVSTPPRCWLTILLLVAILIAASLLAWLLYTCATSSTTEPAPTPTATPTITRTPVPTSVGPTPTPVPAYTVHYYDIGANSQAVASDRIITVYDVSRYSSYRLTTGKMISAPPGFIFISIKLNAINISKTKFSISANDFSLTDSTGYSYEPQTEGRPYYIGDPFGTTMSPGQIEDGKILYLVLASASGFELSYPLEPADILPIIARWVLPW